MPLLRWSWEFLRGREEAARRQLVARWRRADDDGRGRLRQGATGGGPVAVAQPGPGRVRRRHRRVGGLGRDRPLPVAGL